MRRSRPRLRRAPVTSAVAAGALLAGCAGGGFTLSAGDCVVLGDEVAGTGGLAEATIVDCDEPHHVEVIATFRLGPDEVAGDALVEAVREGCLGTAFTDYVGVPADASPLELLPFPPTSEDLERGDREVVCTVRDPGGGTRTGSVRDADATT